MKCRVIVPLSLMSALAAAAFSTGSPVFLSLSVLILLMLLFGFFSVMWAASTVRVEIGLSESTVRRGDDAELNLSLQHRGWLPIAPVTLTMRSSPGIPSREIRLRDRPGKQQMLRLPFHASHVGVASAGVESLVIEDLMGFFSVRKVLTQSSRDLVVLPSVFDVEPLKFAPGDPGSEIMARATEDLSAPSDIRAYQAGDAMKKIHWKLSLRKQELLVRKFEEPELPDALVLMDCSRPPSWGHPEAEADLRDALLETAASVLDTEMKTDHGIRLPLMGQHPVDIEKGMGIALAFENLARTDFTETDRFERVLSMETAHLRKTGAAVVISARLNSNMVDLMIRIRRMGPTVRMYLITFAPNDANLLQLAGRLRQATVEVAYVTPEAR